MVEVSPEHPAAALSLLPDSMMYAYINLETVSQRPDLQEHVASLGSIHWLSQSIRSRQRCSKSKLSKDGTGQRWMGSAGLREDRLLHGHVSGCGTRARLRGIGLHEAAKQWSLLTTDEAVARRVGQRDL